MHFIKYFFLWGATVTLYIFFHSNHTSWNMTTYVFTPGWPCPPRSDFLVRLDLARWPDARATRTVPLRGSRGPHSNRHRCSRTATRVGDPRRTSASYFPNILAATSALSWSCVAARFAVGVARFDPSHRVWGFFVGSLCWAAFLCMPATNLQTSQRMMPFPPWPRAGAGLRGRTQSVGVCRGRVGLLPGSPRP